MASFKSGLIIGKHIASGFFGDVYMGQDPVHGAVAVKRIQKDPTKPDAEWSARKQGLLKEAQNLKAASHRNVVQIHHLVEDETDDSIVFAMEYCAGGSLQGVYDAGPMKLDRLRKVATEITLGLQSLHSRGMLHRDIKPGNILISGSGVAQLGDFGLVTDNLILGYGSQAGYSDHIAPEVWAGGGTSVKADIWSMGMTLYRLLHGSSWYSAAPLPRTVVQDGDYCKTLKWLPHIPDEWRRIIRKMLHDSPDKRVQTATELFAALSRLPTPEWSCSVTPKEIRWERVKGPRKVSVLWQRHNARDHEWHAWSEPLKTGKTHTLGGGDDILSRKEVDRQLQEFFKNNP
ncbi:serine/threonine-protein kinase [Asticcacaulis sp. ZE23SCel15]|uniref:serine/threonine-protein kinase n=1 Tax=Asticcacaulis sp. ZE23SCel15 TaxID=3059027 RepID=UPI00265F371D|nr:serine/threonine-protein kinase [Asticcacaulis sp. ZE23SCel15]WKL58011.1 serine/threonine-protein kinase [Asticcacaulis sp. ZE23SCel15]